MEEHRLDSESPAITGLQTWSHMWKHAFDYKNRASRSEYWIPLLIHVEIGILVLLCILISNVLLDSGDAEALGLALTILGDVLTVYLIVSIVPWVSLTVRRLHDTGKSGWWTFLLLAVGIGTVIILFFCSLQTSVPFFPEKNMIPDIYGPPEMLEEYEPEDNMEQTIYGPPEMFEDNEK